MLGHIDEWMDGWMFEWTDVSMFSIMMNGASFAGVIFRRWISPFGWCFINIL